MFLFVSRALSKKSNKQFSYVVSLHSSTTGSCFNVWCWRVHLHLSLSLSSYSFSLPPHFIAFSFHIPFGSKRVKEREIFFSFHFLLPLSCFISFLGNVIVLYCFNYIYYHLFVFIVLYIPSHAFSFWLMYVKCRVLYL